MSGEEDLSKLLGSLEPELVDGDYVFCTVKDAQYGDYAEARPLASFAEQEGLTLVLLKESAVRMGLPYDGVFKCMTLTAHSSLHAVGLTAAMATKLCEHGISVNVIAAVHHDHLFVPAGTEASAMEALGEFCEGKES